MLRSTWFRYGARCLVALLFCLHIASAQTLTADQISAVELQGTVQIAAAGTTNWSPATVGQTLHPSDHLRTGADSRVVLRWSNQSVITFGALTELEILPPPQADSQSGLHLVRGIFSFFHRDQPGRIQIITRGAVAGIEGTEFVLAVDEADRTSLAVVDGKVSLGNQLGSLTLTNNEQAVVELGQAPIRTAGFIANNLLQWCFYYPAVLDLKDLALTTESQTRLDKSLAAYRSGDLLAALAAYPTNQPLASDSERIYRAALLLSVGQVAPCEDVLANLTETNSASQSQRLAAALRTLIAAVKRQALTPPAPQKATEYLADSYYQQSRAILEKSLEAALSSAQHAVAASPDFGFGWERVAELEFCFGRMKDASSALDKSLALSPRNPQALALKGFILSAQNKPREAIQWFDRAIAVDAALGNAWLGRGLARIRIRDTKGGRQDLLTAAALEPQRAELRSYLGKAYVAAGDDAHATKELNLAKKLDPNDPTAWLYSALQKQQGNQINDAIRDLEKSQSLNDNRSVYRSQLLLDQDQAVRSANLASVYRDAGMTDVSIREAGRAVNYDYANYSAHNFLASSYYGLLQPEQNQARYEPAVESEYLIANLLAPASAGTFSPIMGLQQHFTPYERNHVGIISSTEYLSRGAWTQSEMQYGTFDNFSYGLEGNYHTDPGAYGNNNDEVDKSLSLAVKLDLTPQDNIYAEVGGRRIEGGDLGQYYDPYTMHNDGVRFNEKQNPDVTLGYHHEWQPGVHSLVLASRTEDDYSFSGSVPFILATRFANFTSDPYELAAISSGIMNSCNYHDTLTLYTTELQQIFEQDEHTTIVGTRYQNGSFETSNLERSPASAGVAFSQPAAQQNVDTSLNHISVYGYHMWQIFDPLQLIGGLSYDWIDYPENVLSPPISSQQASIGRVSPKAGFIWQPVTNTTVRFAYTRSLGNQNMDQSERIEPTQVAGFQQTFRSIIGEPSVAQNGVAKDETFGLSLERKFSTGTYLGLTGEILKSKFNQTVGAFDSLPDIIDPNNPFGDAVPSGLAQNVDYHEESLQFTINQLLGRDWAVGGQYRLSYAKLDQNYPEVIDTVAIPASTTFDAHQSFNATLNQINLYVIYNLPCGFFAESDARWYSQNNVGYSSSEPGDDFWQFDAFVGYRFWQRRAQISLGLLNLTDQDYRLNPLNAYSEMPRERTFVARFLFNF